MSTYIRGGVYYVQTKREVQVIKLRVRKPREKYIYSIATVLSYLIRATHVFPHKTNLENLFRTVLIYNS